MQCERLRGILKGLAAGDLIGGPVRMALELSESLIAHSGFNGPDVLWRYVEWWRRGGFDAGRISAQVFEAILSGAPPHRAALDVHRFVDGMTGGCNPAHRSSPLAMCAFLKDADLPGLAAAEAQATHLHPIAGEVSARVVGLCRHLVRGAHWELALTLSGTEVPPAIRNGGYAPDVLGAALFFVDSSTDFEESVRRAIRFAGPENFCPVLAGAIAGARWGDGAIPCARIRNEAVRDRVAAVAEQLAAQWSV